MLDPNNTAQSPTALRRSLRLRDLILYGIILVQPTAPMPVFGVIYAEARGHVVTTILLAMIAMLFTAFSYGRMANAYPTGGSAFMYVGKELHPSLGYMTGWCMAMDYILNPLICTIWCSKAAGNFVPEVPYIAWAIFFAVLFTILNLNGVETSARINAGLAAALGIVLVLFIVAAIRYLLHVPPHGSAGYLLPFYNPATFAKQSVWRGTSIAVLTYIGFDGISTLTDESKQPKRDIPRAIIFTCLVTGILASVEVYLGQLIWPLNRAFPDVDTAFVAIARIAGGPFMYALVNASLLVATIGSGMASQLGAARLLLSMGQDGAIPGRFFGVVDAKNRIPKNNVLLVGAICLAGALAFSYQLGTELLNYGALLAFMGVNVASVVLGWRASRLRQWFPMLLSVLGFVVCFFLWLNLGPLARIVGSIWAVAGVGLYFLRRSYRRGTV
jgi:putrescine importer